MKFKKYRKGKITQGFNKNKNPLYKEAGLSGHTGVDWVIGFGKTVQADNPGLVYKTYTPKQPASKGFTGVYQLCHIDKDEYMEVLYGHLSDIFVKPGQVIVEDTPIGEEGNNGDVYQGGIYYPEGHPDKGTKGSHVHEQWRPVKRVRTEKAGKHYLRDRNGLYKDNAGYCYEIINTNDLNGCIDPELYTYRDTTAEIRRNLTNVLWYLWALARLRKPKIDF